MADPSRIVLHNQAEYVHNLQIWVVFASANTVNGVDLGDELVDLHELIEGDETHVCFWGKLGQCLPDLFLDGGELLLTETQIDHE